MTEILFDTPWWVLAGLGAAGVGFVYAGQTRGDRAYTRLGAGVFGLLLVLLGLSYAVETDLETVRGRTRTLVSSVSDGRWDRVSELLSPGATFMNLLSREQVVETGKKLTASQRVKGVRITSIDAKELAGEITVDLGVTADVGGASQSVPSNWRLAWQKSGGEWKIVAIDNLPDAFGVNNQIKGMGRGR